MSNFYESFVGKTFINTVEKERSLVVEAAHYEVDPWLPGTGKVAYFTVVHNDGKRETMMYGDLVGSPKKTFQRWIDEDSLLCAPQSLGRKFY